MRSAFGDMVVGVGGGAVQGIGTAIFGNSIIGSILSVVLAGSVLKGQKAEIVATVAGYEAGKALFAVSNETTNEAEAVI